MARPKKMNDKDATELDWFILEQFGKKVFGKHHEISRPKLKIKKHPLQQMLNLKNL